MFSEDTASVVLHLRLKQVKEDKSLNTARRVRGGEQEWRREISASRMNCNTTGATAKNSLLSADSTCFEQCMK
jgi:hypothetical protein